MTVTKQETLKQKAQWVRQQTLELCAAAGEGRLASALSWVEIAVALFYGRILNFDPGRPHWEGRDRFVVSKGQGTVCLYPILAELGFFGRDELNKFCKPDSMLGPYGDNVPGIDALWGSLGHGLGVAAGMALAAKVDGRKHMTLAVLGDGECYEGSVWEAAMFAAHHRLTNLVALVDRNGLCMLGPTEQYLRLNPLEDKFRSFGWETTTIDGHSFPAILEAFRDFRNAKSHGPRVIIANTIKGKGIPSLETNPLCHVIIPSGIELQKAREALR